MLTLEFSLPNGSGHTYDAHGAAFSTQAGSWMWINQSPFVLARWECIPSVAGG